jgi:hypothetical protein
VPAWYIDQIASTDEFYTSINHNGTYVASKYIIGTLRSCQQIVSTSRDLNFERATGYKKLSFAR